MQIRIFLILILALSLAGQQILPGNGLGTQAQSPSPATTRQVVSAADGGAPDGISVNPVLSADANLVVFAARATNLLPNQTLDPRFDRWQIYAYDRAQDQIERISAAPAGQAGNGSSGGSPPAVSADGRFVAFTSRADNLVFGDTNNAADIFVRDRQTQQTARVSVASGGTQGNRDSYLPAISADGRVVAFVSQATNLVTGDTNHAADVFVHDRQTGQTTRVSVSDAGMQANGSSGLSAPSLSADGRFVAFASTADNLVAGDSNGAADVFVHDRQTGQTTRVSVSGAGAQANGASTAPAVSHDGRYVAFLSTASNLVAEGGNGQSHVYLRDRQSASTMRISTAHDGAPANRESYAPRISSDGRLVAFASAADNLVPGDTNQAIDVFLHDGLSGQIERVSVGTDGAQANGLSWRPALDDFGRYVAFEATASNLAGNGAPGGVNSIYLRDRGPQATGAYTLAGQILGPDDAAVPNLAVTVGRRFPRRALSDAAGRFAVPNLPPGHYVVDIEAPAYHLQPSFPLVVTIEETTAPQDPLLIRAYACRAPSGLDLCQLQPGDIVLELTPNGADWPQLGGTYFTRAGLFVGFHENEPRLVHVTPVLDKDAAEEKAADGEWEIVESALVQAPVWTETDGLDWAVVRPAVNPSLAQGAADFGRATAAGCRADEETCYGFFAEDGESPIDLANPDQLYDAKLIVQAYTRAGHSLVPAHHPTPTALAGWITPDDLYWHNPQAQRKAARAGERAFFVWVEGPVHVALLGSDGTRIGYEASSTPADVATLAPRLYLYSGEGARVESIAVGQLAVYQVQWSVEITAHAPGNFVVGWRAILPNGKVTLSGGSIRTGETRVLPLTELETSGRTLFMPVIHRR